MTKKEILQREFLHVKEKNNKLIFFDYKNDWIWFKKECKKEFNIIVEKIDTELQPDDCIIISFLIK